MDLRHFSRDRDLDVAEDLEGVVEGFGDAFRRFVNDRRLSDRLDAAVKLLPLTFAVRREAEECEGEGSNAARDKGHDSRERARNRLNREFAFASEAHEAEAGIGDDRHSGIADQRYRLTIGNRLNNMFAFIIFIMFMKTMHVSIDSEMCEQFSGVPRVFAQDQVR